VLLVLVLAFLAWGGYLAMSETWNNPAPNDAVRQTPCQPYGQPVC